MSDLRVTSLEEQIVPYKYATTFRETLQIAHTDAHKDEKDKKNNDGGGERDAFARHCPNPHIPYLVLYLYTRS